VISLRHHLVRVVVVVMALAAGIALGAGPLSDVPDKVADATDQPSPASATAPDDGFGDAFAAATASRVYADGLAGHRVVVLTAPGTSTATVAALGKQVQAAGGTLAGRATLSATLLSPTEKNLVDTLGSRMRSQVASGLVDASAPTYDRMGRLIAAAVGTTGSSAAPTQKVSSIRETLKGAGLVTFDSAQQRTAPLVLVVLGDRADPAIVGGLVSGLAAATTGVVVAAPTRDATLAALRTDGTPTRPWSTASSARRGGWPSPRP
jgi:hypothetical protein